MSLSFANLRKNYRISSTYVDSLELHDDPEDVCEGRLNSPDDMRSPPPRSLIVSYELPVSELDHVLSVPLELLPLPYDVASEGPLDPLEEVLPETMV
ncbi:hypothetical protein RvY_12233 [Ramazzottius varieornatus]|uniref:Uncharacterized protein n=1 Tax=Ramazzottius varieornatus TaxID=947166 RepID=A0A1D1VIS9_RAMVA|nr:hypothetical protein RvY_12233 [Ramazzottius varieornatus]